MPAKNEYVLLVDSMTCENCEEAIEKALSELPNVAMVKADRVTGTVTITTAKGCSSCGSSCQCCQCSPCTCDVCRCCSCGVDQYLKVLDEIDHRATYPQPRKNKGVSSKIREGIKAIPQVNGGLALAFGVACFAVGFMMPTKK